MWSSATPVDVCPKIRRRGRFLFPCPLSRHGTVCRESHDAPPFRARVPGVERSFPAVPRSVVIQLPKTSPEPSGRDLRRFAAPGQNPPGAGGGSISMRGMDQSEVKSATTSAKSIREFPLKSKNGTGSFESIQVIWLKYRTTSAKSLLPLPFTSS